MVTPVAAKNAVSAKNGKPNRRQPARDNDNPLAAGLPPAVPPEIAEMLRVAEEKVAAAEQEKKAMEKAMEIRMTKLETIAAQSQATAKAVASELEKQRKLMLTAAAEKKSEAKRGATRSDAEEVSDGESSPNKKKKGKGKQAKRKTVGRRSGDEDEDEQRRNKKKSKGSKSRRAANESDSAESNDESDSNSEPKELPFEYHIKFPRPSKKKERKTLSAGGKKVRRFVSEKRHRATEPSYKDWLDTPAPSSFRPNSSSLVSPESIVDAMRIAALRAEEQKSDEARRIARAAEMAALEAKGKLKYDARHGRGGY